MAKRVRIQSAHGILIPGGLPNSPRRAMWRSKQQTLFYLAAALVLYGLFCTTRNLVRDAATGSGSSSSFPDLQAFHAPAAAAAAAPFVYEAVAATTDEDCPEYGRYAAARHEPFSSGTWKLPFQRPKKGCRKVVVDEVEEVIREMNKTVKDPDLFRLFENCFPNTLDTSVMWTGVSNENVNEEVRCDISVVFSLYTYVYILLSAQPPPPPRRNAAPQT